jgi:glutamine amidotransferase PdxT
MLGNWKALRTANQDRVTANSDSSLASSFHPGLQNKPLATKVNCYIQ